MKQRSMRTRLTQWYVGALALVALTLSLGCLWLMQHSLVAAADATLRTRLESVVQFIDSMEQRLGIDEMRDEIREYAELTMGRARLEVTDLSGVVVYRPAVAGWDAMTVVPGTPPCPAPLVFADRSLAGEPMRVADTCVTINHHSYHIVGALPMAPALDALSRFRWLLAALVPAVVLIAAFGGYAISRRALEPVDRLTRAAQDITLRNLDRRIDVPPTGDELQRLAATFNDMLARLQAAVAEMTRLTAEASHELRTPVTLIRTTAEVALGMERPAADYRQALADVLAHSERMSTLVGDLLTLARADAGVELPEKTAVDVRQIVREAVDDVRPAAVRASLTLETDLPATAVEIMGHADSLRRLIVILLDNAIKFTKPGGRVFVQLVEAAPDTEDAAVIRVTDTGIGIDPADRPHVFDRFYRGAAARQHTEGSGLGLAIAKTIVERHRGDVAIADGPAGTGCSVRVVLPHRS